MSFLNMQRVMNDEKKYFFSYKLFTSYIKFPSPAQTEGPGPLLDRPGRGAGGWPQAQQRGAAESGDNDDRWRQGGDDG